jgi:hypothetical protein
MSSVNAIRIRPIDNVAVATRAIAAGEDVKTAEGLAVPARDAISYGHKVALLEIADGAEIVKYGECVGHASRAIQPGETVHTHNVTPLPLPEVYIDAT